MAPLKITIATSLIAAIVVGALYLATSPMDSDNDGLSNSLEKKYGTNPKIWDSDGDNHCDSTEIREKTNPLDRNSVPGVECCNGGGPRYCAKIRR